MKVKGLLGLLTSMMLISCGGQEQTELRAWMAEQTKGMRGKVPPLPEIKPLEPVAYLGQSLVVPFSTQKIVATDSSDQQSQLALSRVKQPLESFPLEDLQVQGVVLTGKRPYALVQPKAPNKPMHVGIGEYIGQNLGRIVAIDANGVTILEAVRDNNGVWTEREVTKSVPREGGKK